MQPAKRFDWSNFGIRVLSAAVLAPVGVAAVGYGHAFLLVVLSVAVALLAIEWAKMSAPSTPMRMAAVITAAALAAMFTAYLDHFRIAWFVLAACALLAALIAGNLAERRTDAAFGVVYLAAPMLALMWLRGREPGVPWAFLALTVTWAADSFAFIFGSIFKGPKLWPRISPNKTWSGFIGGLAGAVALALLLHHLLPTVMPHWYDRAFNLPIPLTALAIVGLLGGMATMGGDLLESTLKRRFGVKDSGDLIPGHGGLLDRIDGMMFAVLVIALVRLIGRLGTGL